MEDILWYDNSKQFKRYKRQGKGAHEPNARTAGDYPGFISTKHLGVLLLPLGWDASPLQGYLPALCHPYPFINTPEWRETKWSKVPCLRKQCKGRGFNLTPPDPEFKVLTTWPHMPPLSKWFKKRSLFWFNYLMAYSNSYFSLGICQASE